MKRVIFLLSVIVIIDLHAGQSFAKGSPDKIVVSDGRAAIVEIADREILKKFDPWRGQFIDWTTGPVAAPANQTRFYSVSFYMKWPGRHSAYDRGDLKLIYTLRYVRAGFDGPGFIYLPGEGEDFYSTNVGTIIRDRDDGKWHQASPEWDATMTRLLSKDKGPGVAIWSVQLPSKLAGLSECENV